MAAGAITHPPHQPPRQIDYTLEGCNKTLNGLVWAIHRHLSSGFGRSDTYERSIELAGRLHLLSNNNYAGRVSDLSKQLAIDIADAHDDLAEEAEADYADSVYVKSVHAKSVAASKQRP